MQTGFSYIAAVSVGLAASTSWGAISGTNTMTVAHGGWFTSSYVTYTYKLNVGAGKAAYSGFRLTLTPAQLADLDLGTYTGPGSVANTSLGPGQWGARAGTASNGASSIAFSIRSKPNPKTMLPTRSPVDLTIFDRILPVNSGLASVNSGTIPGNPTTVAGSSMIAMTDALFTPGSLVQAFQSTALDGFDVFLGSALADASGGVTIGLNRPLVDAEIYFSEGDSFKYDIVPAPGAMAFLGMGAMATMIRRRRR